MAPTPLPPVARPQVRRQHSIRPFIADFACIAAKIVIELDGSQHANATESDARRTAYLEAQGWTVIRFWNARLLTDTDNVLREIIARLPAGEEASE